MTTSMQESRSPEVVDTPIENVIVPQRKRALRDVSELAASIKRLGLMNPIVLTPDRVLVSGLHRLEACRSLGWANIPARILHYDELERELAELDENLERVELSTLERADHFRRRKELYEAAHPETRHGGTGRGRIRDADSATLSFADDTAKRTGISARTISEDVQIASDLAPDVKETVRGTPLENRKSDLLALSRKTPEEQRRATQDIHADAQANGGHHSAQAVRRARRVDSSVPEGERLKRCKRMVHSAVSKALEEHPKLRKRILDMLTTLTKEVKNGRSSNLFKKPEERHAPEAIPGPLPEGTT